MLCLDNQVMSLALCIKQTRKIYNLIRLILVGFQFCLIFLAFLRPFSFALSASNVAAVEGLAHDYYAEFSRESQKLSSRSTVLFRRFTKLYNSVPRVPNRSVTKAATSLSTCSVEQRSFQSRPPGLPAS